MKFDFTELEKQLPTKEYNNFLEYFNGDLRRNIKERMMDEEFIIEPLGTNFKKSMMYEEVIFTNVAFEKINNETIKVYIHENAFRTIL